MLNKFWASLALISPSSCHGGFTTISPSILRWMCPLNFTQGHNSTSCPKGWYFNPPKKRTFFANSAFWRPQNSWNSSRCLEKRGEKSASCSRNKHSKVTSRHQAQPTTSESKSKELFGWATKKLKNGLIFNPLKNWLFNGDPYRIMIFYNPYSTE